MIVRFGALLFVISWCVPASAADSEAAFSTETAAAPRGFARTAAETAFRRAEVELRRGDTFAAAASYTEAIRLDPSFGAPYLGLAEIRRALGDYRETEWLLSQAVRLPDVQAEAYTRRAHFYQATGRDGLALSDLQAAADEEPTPLRLRELASAYVQRRAWPAALSVYRKLRVGTELAPDRAPSDAKASAREISETIQALSLLAAETDAVQRDDGQKNWVRRSLRHLATR